MKFPMLCVVLLLLVAAAKSALFIRDRLCDPISCHDYCLKKWPRNPWIQGYCSFSMCVCFSKAPKRPSGIEVISE
ncbi:unnamed protein product [Bursaphelenchus xylophilus]|uniref:(pine wood nematode) hypothetical protein n=1 Tax=Bursaphelenchus xylophilus TaxID=6326 RepID=A0A1I7RVL0_BURXY|nr:unnamed protein product [Bursaphelenchus xylophilus]CAG9081829.1 unnamed protein product [Bursaphelenchus xylophilus]